MSFVTQQLSNWSWCISKGVGTEGCSRVKCDRLLNQQRARG